MTAPARPPDPTALAFVQTVARSRLIDPRRLADIVNGIPEPDREGAPRLAEHLIAGGHLTHFQVQKLMLGLWQGLVLGPYHVLAPLGRGGMGTVYLAQKVDGPPDPHSPVTDLVALKVLPPKKAREEEKTLARFRREMGIGKHLDHPNVTRTLDAGVADGVHFLAMEYVPGETLRQTVVRAGPLGVADAARVFADVAAGLAHAHAKGLIHRDLKPSNIMVTPDGRAKVLDLGLALVVGEPLPDDPSIVGGKGYALGTMDYIAPEQTADASDVGPAADLYSLGCSLYFTLTGAPPFPGGTAQQKIRWHRHETPPPVTQLNPSVPPAFAAVVECLLAKRPDHRPNGAEAVRLMLLPWAGDHVSRAAGADHAPHDAGEAVAEVDTRSFAPSLWDTATAVLPEPLPDPDPDPPPGIALPPGRVAVLAVGVILATLAMAGLGLVVGLYAAARRW